MDNDSTIFLVDDNHNVRDALSLFLESTGLQVRAYPSAQAFLEHYDSLHPGCLVLDIRMPGMNGMELQQELIKRHIDIPIIFLSGHGDIPMSVKALKAGAVDFIEKPFNDEVLLNCIHEAIIKDAQTRVFNAQKSKILANYAQLTRREKEVMKFVISGHSNKEIARELDISHRTIDVHRARIMEKMQANSLPELVSMTTMYGLQNIPRD
ncbi:MAG: response regulator transcription factor [Gammaproteobacteria bacterium]|nr:response regulator transcription factor [Gammaproteobacteria bacterium]